MYNKKLAYFTAALVALFMLGCGGGGSPKNRAPIISSVTFPQSATEGEVINVSVSAEDPDGTIREYSWVRTYGPQIDFAGTETDASAQFIAPDVDEDTPLGLLIEVVDNDGAVSQEFMEIIILNSTQLAKISVIKQQQQNSDNLLVNLEFDQEPLLNSIADYSNSCASGIVIKANHQCLSFNYKLIDTKTLQLELQSVDLTHQYDLTISNKLISVWESKAMPMTLNNLLDEQQVNQFNQTISKQ
jgi:hypothetical protein